VELTVLLGVVLTTTVFMPQRASRKQDALEAAVILYNARLPLVMEGDVHLPRADMSLAKEEGALLKIPMRL